MARIQEHDARNTSTCLYMQKECAGHFANFAGLIKSKLELIEECRSLPSNLCL